MSVASEIQRISSGISSIGTYLTGLGVPGATSLKGILDNMNVLVKPAGNKGQFVGFTANNVIGAVNGVDDVAFQKSKTQYLHTLATSGWTYNSSGTWSGYYGKSVSVSNIYNTSGNVSARGSSITTPPTEAVAMFVSNMAFELDDSAKTLTAYSKVKPSVTIYVAVEGVE